MAEHTDSDQDDPSEITDVASCLSYLKKREVFLYKMMNDPSHKAMLYFLEVLMNSEGPLSVSQLAARFTHKTFTPDMRDACGGSEEGLRRFLQRYPSLFHVNGTSITAVPIEIPALASSVNSAANAPAPITNGSSAEPATATPKPYVNGTIREEAVGLSTSRSLGAVNGVSSYDFGMETEAVKFFQTRMTQRGERWLLIKSLAGHLSQASADIRQVVGPQSEFRRFLLKHPHVFEVQGELVGLKDPFPAACMSKRPRAHMATTSAAGSGRALRPKSLVMPGLAGRREAGATSAPSTPTTTPARPTSAPAISMTANEYKAVMFLRKVLEQRTNNGCAGIAAVMSCLGRAPEAVRNTIGWTQVELEEFLRKRGSFFEVEEDLVTARPGNKMNILIKTPDSRSVEDASCTARALTNRSGRVFHVAKLWGIIDLGQHEHVFFDRSIFKHLEDLQKHFKIDETVYFNSILAPKESRAKWRATQVWKETDREMMERLNGRALSSADSGSGHGNGGSDAAHPEMDLADDIYFFSEEMEDEMVRVLELAGESLIGGYQGHDLDGEGVVDVEDFIFTPDTSPDISIHSEPLHANHLQSHTILQQSAHLNCKTKPSAAAMVTMRTTANQPVATIVPQSAVVTNNHQSKTTTGTAPATSGIMKKVSATIATQTLSTGEIMVTQIFHDSMSKLV